MKTLYRVGFEEIHKLWTDISYRPAFNFIYRISSTGVPVFATTGSLPEHLLGTLPELTSTVWKTIRMPSNRKEFIYEVRRVPLASSLTNAIVNYWQEVSKSYKDQDRCLVFCRTLNDARSLGNALGVPCYHRECLDTTPVDKWRAGENKILPTTLKLGCGFHYQHVRDVIHMEISYSMMDQYQEDSRGGRDGLPCRVITFCSEGFKKPTCGDYDLGEVALYEWSFESKRCLRISPSNFLDNSPISCSLVSFASFCANCNFQLFNPPPHLPLTFPASSVPMPPLSTTSLSSRFTPIKADGKILKAKPIMALKRSVQEDMNPSRKRLRTDMYVFLYTPGI